MQKKQACIQWRILISLMCYGGLINSLQAQEQIFVHTDKSIYVTGENIWLSIYCLNSVSHKASSLSKLVYVELLDAQAQPLIQEKIALEKGTGKGQLFIHPDINSGVYYLRAYTSWMRNFDTALFFEQALTVIHPFRAPAEQLFTEFSSNTVDQPNNHKISEQTQAESSLSISLAESVYGQRQKISLSIVTELQDISSKHAQLSISIHKVHPKLNIAQTNIGDILSPKSKKTAIPMPQDIKYLPEPMAPILQGKISNSSGRLPQLLLNIPGASAEMYSVPIDEQGNFSLEVSPATRSGDLLFWSVDQSLEAADIQLHSPFISAPLSHPKSSLLSEDWKALIESYSVNSQISHIYAEDTHIQGLEVIDQRLRTPFYGEADFSYQLDAYTRFPNLDEVFLEYISYARKHRIKGKRYIYLWDEYASIFSTANTVLFDTAALCLIDGVPILDPDFLWQFDVLKVSNIDLVTKKYVVGQQLFYGIVHFTTYKYDFGGLDIPAYLIRKHYQAIQKPKVFYHPNYSLASMLNSRIPDYRSTLYWEPQLVLAKTETSLSFFSSDDEGTYKVEVNGITQDGILLYAEGIFEVRNGGMRK